MPSLDDWEKGWNEKLKAETLKPEMPILKLLPVDFRAASVLPSGGEPDAPSLAMAQRN